MKLWLSLLTILLILIFLIGLTSTPAEIRADSPTPTPVINFVRPDDIVPGQAQREAAKTPANKVVPILFVPNDVSPHPLGLAYVDQKMQLIQRWYAEQLRGQTFTLDSARVVIGTQPLTYYYGDCFPPINSCEPAYIYLWPRIFDDLYNLGYPYQPDRTLAVFFQQEGIGYLGLGLPNRFLIAPDPYFIVGDCTDVACASNILVGSIAHELGHAFNLGHPLPDSDDSFSKSLMGLGFYFFPLATFVNTEINPERDQLYAHPLINFSLSLKDGGFEDCLAAWKISAGSPTCTTNQQRSGASALQMPPGQKQIKISQNFPAQARQTYDLSGWLKISPQSGPSNQTNLKIKLEALNASNSVLSTIKIAEYTTQTPGWERFGATLTMPRNTTRARLNIITQESDLVIYLDDLYLRPTQQPPPAPIPFFYTNGDSVPTLHPTLKWADIATATSYQIQVATDSAFNNRFVNKIVSSPWHTVRDGLAYDKTYYWRVRAINGAGKGSWSIPWSFVPRSGKNYYNDEFEGSLNAAWSWVREDPGQWWIGGESSSLYINFQQGDLQQQNNARNLLLRNSPPGDFEAATGVYPIGDDQQQAGVLIYQDDDNYLSLMQTHNQGFKVEFRAEINGVLVEQQAVPMRTLVLLKIARIGKSYYGYYSIDALTWKPLGKIKVNWPAARMGLAAFDPIGPQSGAARFLWFRVSTSPTKLVVVDSAAENKELFLPIILSSELD